MKRIKLIYGLIAIGFIAIAVLFFFGRKAPEARTLRFWHFQCEPEHSKAIRALADEFEKKYNCKVELTELTWNDGKTKLAVAFNSNTAPDVLELGSDWVAQFSSSGVLAALNNDSVGLSKFVDFALPPTQWKGKTYCLPWFVDTRVLFYNKALMKRAGLGVAPPKTMSELLDYSQRISDLGDVYGWGANGADKHRLYKKVLHFIWTYGGDILDTRLYPVVNSPENARAFEMYLQLAHSGMMETQRELDVAFVQGKIGFWISGSWMLPKLEKEGAGLDFGVALMPGLDGSGKPGLSFAGGEYLAVNEKSDKKDLAIELIKYITDGANTIEYCKKFSDAGFPADKKYFADDYFKGKKYLDVFAEQLKYSRTTPVHPQWLEIESIFETAMEEVLLGKKGTYEALPDAEQEMRALLGK